MILNLTELGLTPIKNEEVEFDKDHPVKDVVVIKIDCGVF